MDKTRAAMGTDATTDRIKKELLRAFDNTRAELDRIEILAAGLAAFNSPIPSYEPMFRHLPQLNLNAHELAAVESRT
jgi:hypothetical protein